jgi:hypothetical protein
MRKEAMDTRLLSSLGFSAVPGAAEDLKSDQSDQWTPSTRGWFGLERAMTDANSPMTTVVSHSPALLEVQQHRYGLSCCGHGIACVRGSEGL